MELAFPPVSVAQELVHVLCKAEDATEFLASAHAWLVLVSRAERFSSPEQALAFVQAEHDSVLPRTLDAAWRAHLLELLDDTLFQTPSYRAHWAQLRAQFAVPHERLHSQLH